MQRIKSSNKLTFPTIIDGHVLQQDVASEIAAELQGYPDFIIGNYSDGNLVASLLAYKMGVTQVRAPSSMPYYIAMRNLIACVIVY